ncbi:hypothetical protein BKP54_09150 [Ensifer sp. 1H6]|nr:hypothetical protein BKP54_09150 [Ensifer sp. 1H6]
MFQYHLQSISAERGRIWLQSKQNAGCTGAKDVSRLSGDQVLTVRGERLWHPSLEENTIDVIFASIEITTGYTHRWIST